MKVFKLTLVIMAAAILTLGLSGVSFAYHDGGVAYCEGCHTMHNSVNGVAVSTTGGATQFNGHSYLLKGSDQSSTCLNCHAKADTAPTSYHELSIPGTAAAGQLPQEMTPGGDFGWLKITTTWTPSYGGAAQTNNGNHHGHNIVAADFGLSQSPNYTAAPGGVYPASNLYCSSCHDPHGKYRVTNTYTSTTSAIGTNVGPIIGSGSYGTTLPTTNGNGGAGESVGVYRLLAGNGYLPDSVSGVAGATFTNASPFAFAPSTYNRSESATDTRVAYGSGMSEWCANCHTAIHNPNYPTTLEHPTGNNASAQLSNTDSTGVSIAAKYNAYVYSGNLTGSQATSYTSMVPYEEGVTLSQANYAALATHAKNDGSVTSGPSTGSENVMCLSCHRAHASAWPYALRWNATGSEYLTIQGVYPGIDSTITEAQAGQYNMGYTQAQVQRAFYDRPATNYATYQRSLCNKCHAKD